MSIHSSVPSAHKVKTDFKGITLDSLTFGYLLIIAVVAIVWPTEEQLLNLKFNLILSALAVAIGLIMTVVLNGMRVSTLGHYLFEPMHEKMKRPPIEWYKTFWGWQLAFTFIVTCIVGFKLTHFSFYEIFDESGFLGAKRIFTALLSPEPSVFPIGVLAIIETIYIAFMSTVIAIPMAFLLAFFAAKNIMGGSRGGFIVYTLIRTFLNVTRSVEPLIWAIIFSVWVGIGPFAGMLALMFHTISSLTKQYSEQIESVGDGPIEGIKATGANAVQVVWFAIVPQVILPYIAFTIYRWDINVRMATVIGLVGGGGIGTLLIQYQGQAMWREVGTLAVLIVVVVWSMDTISAYLREALK